MRQLIPGFFALPQAPPFQQRDQRIRAHRQRVVDEHVDDRGDRDEHAVAEKIQMEYGKVHLLTLPRPRSIVAVA